MKELILHLGFHKTATTSIQRTLLANEAKLRKQGILFPVFRLGRRKISNHSIPLYSLFCPNPENYHINQRWQVNATDANEHYEAQLNRALRSGYSKVVLSGEDISQLPEAALGALRKKIEACGFTIRTIAYIRSPSSNMTSNFQQRIRSGSALSAMAYWPQIKKINKVQSIFPETEFIAFKQACEHPAGPVGLFLQRIGVDNCASLKIVTANESISNEATRLCSYLHEHAPLRVAGKLNPKRANRHTGLLHSIKGKRFQLTQHETAPFLENLRLENEWLKENFSEEFCDKGIFPGAGEAEWTQPQIDELAKIIPLAPPYFRTLVFNYFNESRLMPESDIVRIFDCHYTALNTQLPPELPTNFWQRRIAGLRFRLFRIRKAILVRL
ncbi:MAG: hypothetical protein V7754_10185 [Halioglobus sp.]